MTTLPCMLLIREPLVVFPPHTIRLRTSAVPFGAPCRPPPSVPSRHSLAVQRGQFTLLPPDFPPPASTCARHVPVATTRFPVSPFFCFLPFHSFRNLLRLPGFRRPAGLI
ncbi:hypothetical protein K438DRAFT_1880695 [Mycena galopus ATCC 62051]|nr:hypothetical protein K438DRAFT_1880695 [Mycena galopus ATCC 62051]